MPPFRAMAMARMAADLESSGRRVLHLEVGQPATGAPLAARQAVGRLLDAGAPLGYTNAPGLPALRRGIVAHYAEWYGVDVDPADVLVVVRRLGRLRARLPRRVRRRRPRRRARARLPVLPQRPARARRRARAHPRRAGHPLGADGGAARCRGPAARPRRRLPVEPDGHGAVARPAGRDRRVVRRPRRAADRRRDLPRHHLRRAGGDDARRHPRRSGRQQLQQVLLDDRLAARLDGRARTTSATPSSGCSRTCTSARRTCPRSPASPRWAPAPSSTPTSPATRRTAASWSTGSPRPASTASPRPTGRSTCTPTSDHLTDSATALCARWLDELGLATTPGLDFDLARGEHFVRFSYAGPTDDVAAACDALAGWAP